MADFSKWLSDTLKSRESLGNNNLEQFDSEALGYFIKFIESGLYAIAAVNTNTISDVDLENLHALIIMIYNAKIVVDKRELAEKN